MIDEIRDSWGWIGIDPDEIVGINEFGNILGRDRKGAYWRLCPEDVYCKVIAASSQEFQELMEDEEFCLDWEMTGLVKKARETVGPLKDGHRYCLKIPGVLGGEYGGENLASMPLDGLIRFSGDLALQIRDLPDGAQISLNVVD